MAKHVRSSDAIVGLWNKVLPKVSIPAILKPKYDSNPVACLILNSNLNYLVQLNEKQEQFTVIEPLCD